MLYPFRTLLTLATLSILTAIGDGRMAGTFEFTAGPGQKNPETGMRDITDGKFDVPYSGKMVFAPEGKGGRLGATLNGMPYNAAGMYAFLTDYTGKPGIPINTTNSENGISLGLEGVTDTGTYALANMAPVRSMVVGRNGGTADFCCWQSTAVSTGSITITSLSDTRIKGTFKGTLAPDKGEPSTVDMVVVGGTFDVGVK